MMSCPSVGRLVGRPVGLMVIYTFDNSPGACVIVVVVVVVVSYN